MSPDHVIPLKKQIFCFEISPYVTTPNLFCAAVQNKIILGLLQLPEDNESKDLNWEKLRELDNDTRCQAISFAPDSSLDLPKHIKFCTAGADFVVRIFRSNLVDSDTVQEISGHTSYVNDVAWEPNTGKYLASVSDDHSCHIRSQSDDFKSEIIFRFKSPAMAVRWHTERMEKLLVAEKRGTIHVYNIESRQIVLSIETSKAPLVTADWCMRNDLAISSLAAGEISIYDLRFPYRAAESKTLHEDGGLALKYSPNVQKFASIGRPGVTLKVSDLKSDTPQLVTSLKLFGGLSWHQRYVCAADDTKLCFWKVF